MSRILVCLRKEFLQIRRNPLVLRLLISAPIIQLVLFGYAATLDVTAIPTVICDLDRSAPSRRLWETVSASGYFREVARVVRPADVFAYLDSGRAGVALLIPADYDRATEGNGTARVQALFDGSNSNEATQARAYMTSILLHEATVLALDRASRGGPLDRPRSPRASAAPIDPRIRILYNETLQSSHFMVPGVIAMILMVLMVTLTAVSLVTEKETGTLQQILVMPLPPYVFLLGKILPFVIVGLFDVGLVLLGGHLVFGMPIRGSIPLLYGVSLLYITTLLGFGLVVSSVASSQPQALVGAYAVVGPNLLLTGFIFPVENMPAAIQYLTYAFPMRYFLVVIRGIMLKGIGLETLWPQVTALGACALASFALSVWLYGRQRSATARV